MFTAEAQNQPCQLDKQTLQFVGTPVKQARCLLRPNRINGKLDAALRKLPAPLEKIIGANVKVGKEKLRGYLVKQKIAEKDVGGALDTPLSLAKVPNGASIQTLYFIIHDTSTPYLKDELFPPDMNEKTWKFNDLQMWLKMPVAHIFVNRLGDSLTTVDFGATLGEKRWGTKFARDILQADAKALQIHIELVQARRRDAANANPENDAVAPLPGFTEPQYERLALLYICASVRRGTWLIPAYHSAIDAGIKDAHDDPQNFELKKFGKSLQKLLKNMR